MLKTDESGMKYAPFARYFASAHFRDPLVARMDLKDLRYFVAVCEQGSFLQASSVLHTVQSNVSARIKRLEVYFGATLFQRDRRGVVLTKKGEVLYAYARRLFLLLEETRERVRTKDAA